MLGFVSLAAFRVTKLLEQVWTGTSAQRNRTNSFSGALFGNFFSYYREIKGLWEGKKVRLFHSLMTKYGLN